MGIVTPRLLREDVARRRDLSKATAGLEVSRRDVSTEVFGSTPALRCTQSSRRRSAGRASHYNLLKAKVWPRRASRPRRPRPASGSSGSGRPRRPTTRAPRAAPPGTRRRPRPRLRGRDPISAVRAPAPLTFAALECWRRPLEAHGKIRGRRARPLAVRGRLEAVRVDLVRGRVRRPQMRRADELVAVALRLDRREDAVLAAAEERDEFHRAEAAPTRFSRRVDRAPACLLEALARLLDTLARGLACVR